MINFNLHIFQFNYCEELNIIIVLLTMNKLLYSKIMLVYITLIQQQQFSTTGTCHSSLTQSTVQNLILQNQLLVILKQKQEFNITQKNMTCWKEQLIPLERLLKIKSFIFANIHLIIVKLLYDNRISNLFSMFQHKNYTLIYSIIIFIFLQISK